jgi:hypothetical protein
MSNPQTAIEDAKQEIERRRKLRQGIQLEFRSPAALEMIADEMTMIRAEMTVMRALLATNAAAKRK